MSDKEDLISINIDGNDYKVVAGSNVVDAAASVGIEIPHYCYHPKLSISANCRMCLVELGMPVKNRETGEVELNADGSPKICFMPKPATACSTNASPGMHIRTDTDAIKDCRNGVTEFILLNHPLDCPICDQAGECSLQEYAAEYGRGYTRFVEDKNVKPKCTSIGPRVILDNERCILCSRCIRFCKDILDDEILGLADRGSYSTVTCCPGKELDNNYSLNTVDLCPVGALTSKDFRFKMRVWFLKKTASICTESSVGVNTDVWSREGKIYRITPRQNDEVNDSWMPDSGRELYKSLDSDDRLHEYSIDGAGKSKEDTMKEAANLVSKGDIAYVVSGNLTVEEQFQLSKVIEIAPGPVYFAKHKGEGDGFLISSDKTPNVRGALVMGLIKGLPGLELKKLSTEIDTGKVKTVLSYGENLADMGLSADQIKKIKVIYFGAYANFTSEKADVVVPTQTVFEKSGTFINQQFRLQKFNQCIFAPNGVMSEMDSLALLIQLLRKEEGACPDLSQLWSDISAQIKVLNGIAFDEIPDTGTLIDGSAFKDLPFCEGDTLHFKSSKEPSTGKSV